MTDEQTQTPELDRAAVYDAAISPDPADDPEIQDRAKAARQKSAETLDSMLVVRGRNGNR